MRSYSLKYTNILHVVAHTFNPRLLQQKEVDFCESSLRHLVFTQQHPDCAGRPHSKTGPDYAG